MSPVSQTPGHHRHDLTVLLEGRALVFLVFLFPGLGTQQVLRKNTELAGRPRHG